MLVYWRVLFQGLKVVEACVRNGPEWLHVRDDVVEERLRIRKLPCRIPSGEHTKSY